MKKNITFAVLLLLFQTMTIQKVLAQDVIFHGARREKKIVLTFDADMTAQMKQKLHGGIVKGWYNKAVIDYLEETKTPATLFLTGMWIEAYPDITKKLSENNLFELANHSYSHPSFYKKCYGLRRAEQNEKKPEIEKTKNLLKNYQQATSYFRFPGGCFSKAELDLVKKEQLKTAQWDVVGGDAFAKSPKKGIDAILKKTQNGSIIILHMHGGPNAPTTAKIIQTVIPALHKRGFKFVKLSQLHV